MTLNHKLMCLFTFSFLDIYCSSIPILPHLKESVVARFKKTRNDMNSSGFLNSICWIKLGLYKYPFSDKYMLPFQLKMV